MATYKNETGYTLNYSKYVLLTSDKGEQSLDGYKRDLVYNQILKPNEEVDIHLCMSQINVVEDKTIEVTVLYEGDIRVIKIHDNEKKAHELLPQVLDYINQYNIGEYIDSGKIQRKFKIGYPIAARLLDLLQDKGIIGLREMGKGRRILNRVKS